MTRIALAIGTAVLLTGRTDGQEMRFFYPAPSHLRFTSPGTFRTVSCRWMCIDRPPRERPACLRS
jgi:hypothetical protein